MHRLWLLIRNRFAQRLAFLILLFVSLLHRSASAQAPVGFESVSLTWNGSVAPSHIGYNVYRRIRRFSSGDPQSIIPDGKFPDWGKIEPATQYPYPPEDEPFIKDVWVANDDDYLYLRVRSSSSFVDNVYVYLDVDRNAATGTKPWARGLKIGAEFRLRLVPGGKSCAAYLDPFNPNFNPSTMVAADIWMEAAAPLSEIGCAIGNDDYAGIGLTNNGVEVRIPLAKLGPISASRLVGMDMYFHLDTDFFPTIGYGNKTPLKFEYGYHRVNGDLLTGTSYKDAVGGGITYEYVVTEVMQGGAEKVLNTTFPLRVPRAHPANFNVSVVSPTSLSMTWTAPDDPSVVGVRIVRSQNHYPVNEHDGDVVYEGRGTKFTDTGLRPITSYFYTAFGYDGFGHYSRETWDAQDRSMPTSLHGPLPISAKDDYMIYFGSWDDALIRQAEKYKVVMLHPGGGSALITPEQVRDIQDGADNIAGTDDDVTVIAYISIGEDYGDPNPATPGYQQPRQNLSPEFNDGTGPCHYDWVTGEVVYENRGFPSFYLDEIDRTTNMSGQDHYPDQNLDWGGLYVNSGDPKWQAFLKQATYEKDGVGGFDYILNTLGADGVFLDTVGVSSPWSYWDQLIGDYYWIKDGHLDFLAKIGNWYPNKFIIPNRPMQFTIPELAGKRYDDFRSYVNGIFWESYTADVKFWWRGHSGDVLESAVRKSADNSDGLGFTTFVLDYYKVMIEAQEGGENQLAPWYRTVLDQVQRAQNSGFHTYIAPSRSLAETSDDVYRIDHPETLAGKSDLAVHSVFGTDLGSGNVDLAITVINQSQTTVAQPFAVQVVHNTTALPTQYVTATLGPWQQYTFNRTIQMQDIGNNIHVTVDPNGDLDDFDRNNNEHDTYMDSVVHPAPAGVQFVPKIPPDAVISAFDVIPDIPEAGKPMTLRITYGNIGAGVMKASRAYVWLGTSQGGGQIGNVPTSFLMPGQTKTIDLKVTPKERGAYSVSAFANAVNTLVEANQQNNALQSRFTVISSRDPLTTWSNDPRAISFTDTIGDGAGGRDAGDIAAAWVSQSDDSMLFRMKLVGETAPDLTYLLFLDTDANAATGYPAGGVGADFMVYNGDLYGYAGTGSDWMWERVANSDQASFVIEQDQHYIDMAVTKSALGIQNPNAQMAFRFAVSDANSNTSDYCPNSEGIGYPPVEGAVRIDGEFADWNSVPVLIQDGTHRGYNMQGKLVSGPLNPAADLQTVWATRDDKFLFFRLKMQGPIDFSVGNLFIFLDTDSSPATGYSTSLGAVGADYLFWNGRFYQHQGAKTEWNWRPIEDGTAYRIGNESTNHLELGLLRSTFGWQLDVPIKLVVVTQADGINHFAPDLGKNPVTYPNGNSKQR